MNLYSKQLSIFLLAVTLSASANAQFTKVNNDPDADFKQAKELYQNNQFSLAYPLFKTLYTEDKINSSIPVSVQAEAKYYSIVCGLELKDETAETKAIDFIELDHNEPRAEMMSYHLAEYYYREKNFDKAARYYERTSTDNLSNDEIANMKFHQAYAYFTMQRFNDAEPLFDAIRQIPNDPNYVDANYYYGFIAFSKKHYDQALGSFKITEGKENYKGIVPYYITEIYYYKGEKDKALEYGEKALQQGGQYYDLQMRQIVGHIYFEKKNFAKALTYLEQYVSKTQKVSREDLYELSYCYYQAKQYKKAVAGFKEIGGKQDSLAQNAMYLLADSYLKIGQKPSARSAFLFCALNSSNLTQKEISKFNYGKLSFELGYTDVALNELKEFVTAYPKSDYSTEAKELLVNVLANTNNYKEALDLVSSLKTQTETVKKVYPKILYGRAVELVNDQQIVQADNLLNAIYVVDYNTAQLPYANFWKGEIAFRTNQYDSAVYYLTDYISNPVTNGEVNPTNARYTLGYSAMRQEDYTNALKYFEQITTTLSASSTPLEQDAYARSADCYFMKKNYGKSMQMFDNILSKNLKGSDYALYQKAIITGASGQYAQKVSLLQSIPMRFPSSTLAPDANMEVANTYLATEKYDAAIPPLNDILKNRNAEPLKPQAYLKLGIAYFNQGNNNEALNNFKKLISGYPNSEESNDAVDYVRNIFVDNQRPADFVAFMKQNGKDVSYTEQDSLTYISANNVYETKNYDNALSGFTNYLRQFPDGQYAIDVNYKVAGIYNDRKDFKNALNYYNAVAAKAPNKYAEISVLQAARITYFELKDYAKAEQYFQQLKDIAVTDENKLESMRGLLRCQYKLSQFTEAVPNAQELLQQKGAATDDKMMANMIVAKNYQNNNQLFEASAAYKAVIDLGKSEYAAEARYRVAEILFLQNKLPEAEKAGFDAINKAGSYNYWITKSYILLGDVYFKEEDYFNAEATLKSVVENSTIPELQEEAQKKLDAVVAEKNSKSKVEQG
ncbi:tetratricopeptide repeat protein [Panacibacter ginsenosidivorans]|uniref:Tetratricopeptide repeat protein n=1 Tax=Panacibacter ginsenosidivorans TaxID=1813871 RepID=A0A5B8VF75_9BACT|nr:tetratricopeptide repeat protein [Panacibacter ginsenosidivorans]QEC69969.1 tetratricopeptide repeat protein [Panacibacter ginsenosidivorans]